MKKYPIKMYMKGQEEILILPDGQHVEKSFHERTSALMDGLVDNLNYRVLIESLSEGESLTPAQLIILFNLAKKRNSNVEEDIKNWKPTI